MTDIKYSCVTVTIFAVVSNRLEHMLLCRLDVSVDRTYFTAVGGHAREFVREIENGKRRRRINEDLAGPEIDLFLRTISRKKKNIFINDF